MQRLIIEYPVGDGYTYSTIVTVPVVYESAEAFIVKFEEICKEWYEKRTNRWVDDRFTLAGQEWCASSHYEDGQYIDPYVMTVDEFFKTVESK